MLGGGKKLKKKQCELRKNYGLLDRLDKIKDRE